MAEPRNTDEQTDAARGAGAAGARRRYAVVATLLVGGWLVVCAWQSHLPTNSVSRFAGMEALVDHGTWAIDDTTLARSTVDKVRWRGAYYSSKPPLLIAFGAGFYAAIQAVTGWTFADDAYELARWMRLLFGVAPWLCGVLLFGVLLARTRVDVTTERWALLAWILATLPTAYGSHVSNHVPATTALLAAAVLLGLDLPGLLGRSRRSIRGHKPTLVAAGLCGGAAAAFDLGSAPIVAAGAALASSQLIRTGRSAAAATLLVATAVAPIVQLTLQYQIAGTWVPFYLIDEAYYYPGSYWTRPIEFDALSEPRAVYAFHAFMGHHGLFAINPWLILAVPWLFASRWRARRPAEWAIWGAVVFIVGYYLLETTNYGGRCVGMRWWMILTPFVAAAAVCHADRTRFVARRPMLAGALIGFGAVIMLSGAVDPWEESLWHLVLRALGLDSVVG